MSYGLEEDIEFTPREGSFLESVVADELREEHRWEFESGSVVLGVVTDVAETSESLTVEITLPDDTVVTKEFGLDDFDYVKTILTENDVPIDEPEWLEGVLVPVYFCSNLLDNSSESYYTDFNTGILGTADEEMLEPFLGPDEVTIKKFQYDMELPSLSEDLWFISTCLLPASIIFVAVLVDSGLVFYLGWLLMFLPSMPMFVDMFTNWTAEEVETVKLEQ